MTVAMPDQLLVGRIGEHEPMVGTLKQRREARRLDKHLPEAEKLLVGVETLGSMMTCLTHLPILAKIFCLVTHWAVPRALSQLCAERVGAAYFTD